MVRFRVAFALLILASGCDAAKEKLGLADPPPAPVEEPAEDEAPKKDEAPEKNETPAPETVKAPAPEKIEAPAPAPSEAPAPVTDTLTQTEVAYAAGRKYGMSCFMAVLGRDPQAEAAHGQATRAAARLGASLPPRPTKDTAMKQLHDMSSGNAFLDTKGHDVGSAFLVGLLVVDIELGVGVKGNVADQLKAIERFVQRVPVPSSTWQTALDTLRTNPTDEAVRALVKPLDAHFHYDDAVDASAWTATNEPAPARELFAYTSAAGRYRVTFPFEPEEVLDEDDAGVEWRTTVTKVDAYSVSWTDFADASTASTALYGYIDALRKKGAEDQSTTVAGHPGHRLTIKRSGVTVSVRAFLVGRRFYKVMGGTSTDAAKIERFFDSFALAES